MGLGANKLVEEHRVREDLAERVSSLAHTAADQLPAELYVRLFPGGVRVPTLDEMIQIIEKFVAENESG